MPDSASLTRETFTEWVHDALNHLYDSPHLQTHPLAARLPNLPESTLPHSQRLRRVLLDAIQAMRPEAGAPAQSSDWRAYRILELRYLEGLSPSEVMSQLGLGKSQYFREQGRVVEAVTAGLWEAYAGSDAPAAPAEPAAGGTARENLARTEAQRLSHQATWEVVEVAQLLGELRTVVEPLARVKAAAVRWTGVEACGAARADRVMLRQAILNVITYALDQAAGGHVEIAALPAEGGTGLRVTARAGGRPAEGARRETVGGPTRETVGLNIGRQLMHEMGGRLDVSTGEAGGDVWEASLAWPGNQPQTLLVIDDNRGFVDLFQRYLAASAWHVIGATDGAAARQALTEARPAVIVLDVMMPKEDGWELLMALKAAPETRDIPVVICSVLTEPQLAVTLGAAAYLPKPVTQQALLQALAPWHPGPGGEIHPGASPTPEG
jgi:CheY-like chemotaxis protein